LWCRAGSLLLGAWLGSGLIGVIISVDWTRWLRDCPVVVLPPPLLAITVLERKSGDLAKLSVPVFAFDFVSVLSLSGDESITVGAAGAAFGPTGAL
jgi:hypothetical protein